MSEPDTRGFLETLATAPDSDYDPYTRYRDFRAVFSTEQGNRVLHEILKQGGINKELLPMAGPVDPLIFAKREGRRSMALTIIGIMNNEPRDRPTQANHDKEDD